MPHNMELSTLSSFDSIVKVHIGRNRKEFLVHNDLLEEFSGFFRTGLRPNGSGESPSTVLLRKETEGTFRLFLRWLYNQRRGNNVVEEYGLSLRLESGTLCALFLLAERLSVPKLKWDVKRKFVFSADYAWFTLKPTTLYPALVKQMWETLEDDDRFRELVTDWVVYSATIGWYPHEFEDFPPTFLTSVIAKTAALDLDARPLPGAYFDWEEDRFRPDTKLLKRESEHDNSDSDDSGEDDGDEPCDEDDADNHDNNRESFAEMRNESESNDERSDPYADEAEEYEEVENMDIVSDCEAETSTLEEV